ncbi:MAG: type II secretion system protein GspM [Pseudomonadota bacterium]
MRAWFESLEPRERQLLVGGSIVLVIAAIWLFILDPIAVGRAAASDDVARKQLLIERARSTLTAAAPGSAAGTTAGNRACTQSMTLLVATTVREAGLGNAYRSSSPFGNDGLRVSLENASFDQTIEWLGRLQSECGIEVDSGSFTNRTDPGRVDASIALERSPS